MSRADKKAAAKERRIQLQVAWCDKAKEILKIDGATLQDVAERLGDDIAARILKEPQRKKELTETWDEFWLRFRQKAESYKTEETSNG